MTGSCAALVVEDDSPIRELVADSLHAAGFEVRTAANGQEALAVLQTRRPDAIVLDLEMPVMDGASFRLAQRRTPELAAIPVVVFSGGANLEEQAARLEAAATLRKPCDPNMLVAVIREVVRTQRVHGRVRQLTACEARPVAVRPR